MHLVRLHSLKVLDPVTVFQMGGFLLPRRALGLLYQKAHCQALWEQRPLPLPQLK